MAGVSPPLKPRPRPQWMDAGACRNKLAVFYPDTKHEDSFDYAKTICRRCPVNVECLRYALDYEELHGCWGGRTPDERIAMLKSRKKGW